MLFPSKVIAQINTEHTGRVPVTALRKSVHHIQVVLLGNQQRGHKPEAFHASIELGICDTAFPDHRTANPSFESTEGELLKSLTSVSLVQAW